MIEKLLARILSTAGGKWIMRRIYSDEYKWRVADHATNAGAALCKNCHPYNPVTQFTYAGRPHYECSECKQTYQRTFRRPKFKSGAFAWDDERAPLLREIDDPRLFNPPRFLTHEAKRISEEE